jgi:phosphatidylinositol kinase/protein kinase (PI-3  family)
MRRPFYFLDIRTYGVITLNEECGFIQWVLNTIPIRPVLVKGYEARRVRNWVSMPLFFKFLSDINLRAATWPMYSKRLRNPQIRRLVKFSFRRFYHCIYNFFTLLSA